MSLVPIDSEDGERPRIQVQSIGPTILAPALGIGNTVARSNEIVADHREWLAKFPEIEGQIDYEQPPPSISQPPTSLITPPPALELRAAFPAPIPQFVPSQLCDCNPQISAVSVSILLSFSRLSATTDQSSQAAAQSVASISSAALLSAEIASSRANAASGSAALSASSAIQSAINSANSAVAAAQASASADVSSANSVAADAKVTTTFTAAQAQTTISQVNVQASASVLASRIMSKTETRFALVVTISIIGSSLVSILAYFLLLRYRKRHRPAKQDDSARVSTSSSNGPSLSEFPHPRKSEWSFVREANHQPMKEIRPGREMILPDEPPRALFSNSNPALRPERDGRVGELTGPRPELERVNTLINDAEHSDQSPKFKSLLVESLRGVSQFGDRISKDFRVAGEAGKRSNIKRHSQKILDDDEMSEIGTAL